MENISNREYSNFKFLGIGKETAKQKERREKRKAKLKEHGGAFVVFNEITQKFNPASMVPRSSALTGFRLNIFGLSRRIFPAFLTEQELQARGFNLANAKKARDAWEKIQKAWRMLGGDPAHLKKAIMQGYNKPIFKTKKAKARHFDGGQEYSGVADPYSGVAIAGYVSLGLSIIGSLVGIVNKAGLSKNPYDNKQIDTAGMDVPSQEELNRMVEEAIDDPNTDLGSDDEIWGISKPLFITGVTIASLLALWGIYEGIKYFKNK